MAPPRSQNQEVRDFLKGPEASKYMNEAQVKSIWQVLKSGIAQEVTLKIVNQNRHARVFMEELAIQMVAKECYSKYLKVERKERYYKRQETV